MFLHGIRSIITATFFISMASASIDAAAETAAAIQNVVATTDVLLADGASIKLTLNVAFDNTSQFATDTWIRSTVTAWASQEGKEATLFTLKNGDYADSLINRVKNTLSAKGVSILGYEVIRPGIEAFELRTRTIAAVMASGQNIELTFARAPAGTLPAITADQMSKIVVLLGTMKLEELPTLQARINNMLTRSGFNDVFPIVSIRLLSCKCP